MEKALFEVFNFAVVLAAIIIPFFKTKGRAFISGIAMTLLVAVTTIITVSVFTSGTVEFRYGGSWITGEIPIRIDYLSAWFMLVISFTFLTGTFYGLRYMSAHKGNSPALAMHAIAFLLAFASLINLCIVQNGIVFLVFWEIMALSSFILIIFEYQKPQTLKAGLNFLIQSHISILFLTIAFLLASMNSGSFDFAFLSVYNGSQNSLPTIALFLLFFIGFAIKAGFLPFHTWLPLAHPAAPAHISGIMSGVIIKIGIYGILRMLLLIRMDMVTVGYIIMAISVVTGIYGVMLAIIQHNLKKLLAYHSIENIGIIGIGIGLGTLGIGYEKQILVIAGFGGALLHTLNHSLFKSLLFFGAGNVYLATHSMKIEGLGGLIRKMPHTAYLFLIGSLAICGLPPFNGFISEFFIYSGLFHGLTSGGFGFTIFILFVILGLVLIGGLAFMCFTKAFGIVFLGTPRERLSINSKKESIAQNLPLYIIAITIVVIGVFPSVLTPWLLKTIKLYAGTFSLPAGAYNGIMYNITVVGWYSLGFIALILVLLAIRHYLTYTRPSRVDDTWGCGYTGNTEKMQYTASSFIRTYRKMAEPVLDIKKEKQQAVGLYPVALRQETHPYDKLEKWAIDKPVYLLRKLLNRFVFLQNGNIQTYILYGFIFVGLTIVLPLVFNKLMLLVDYFNRL